MGRRISRVAKVDPLTATTLAGYAPENWAGATIERAERFGKLLVLGLSGGPVPRSRLWQLGIHFSMAGLLLVDRQGPIAELLYGPRTPADRAEFDRLQLYLDDGSEVVISDPRRLARLSANPKLEVLGPDATKVTAAELRQAIGRSKSPLKALLLDQGRVAGLGNLLVDEVLYLSGLDPRRTGRSLSDGEFVGLAAGIRLVLTELGRRGGSHRGDLQPRTSLKLCPKDGQALRRERIGGRTTLWCPVHQG